MKKRRSGFSIMSRLIVLVKPLTGVMVLGIMLGTLGYLCAIFLPVLAGKAVSMKLMDESLQGWVPLFTVMIVIAFARGFLHYGEQYCNHYIAFRILAIIRHKVFAALRKLSPAKLEGKDSGNLITIITSDIELLEVFYAHTISPIAIAILVSLIMVVYIGKQYLPAALIALLAYLVVGVCIPLWNGHRSSEEGMKYRTGFAKLNSFVLDSLYGIDETIQYGSGSKTLKQIDERSKGLGKMQGKLSQYEGSQRSVTNLAIQIFSWIMILVMIHAYMHYAATLEGVLTASIAMMSSFGPVTALSSLSNNLNQTLASGERVLSLLEEVPQVKEVSGKEKTEFENAKMNHVGFHYDQEEILRNFSLEIPKGKIIGLHGVSGSGKSTVLKLLMRFWDVQKGAVEISDKDIRKINTKDLRDMESYVTQDTWLFHDTISANIAVARQNASQQEIEEAARKAGIHDFIQSLPDGYNTNVGEHGDMLSDGERQRIGIARAFLHDSDLILLDEPTSNLDALNEGIILKSLKESKENKTVILVSHRQSTMSIADQVFEMEKGRIS